MRIVCEIYDVLYYNLVSRACEVWLKRSGWCIAKCATPYLGYAARSPSDSFNITTEIYTYFVYQNVVLQNDFFVRHSMKQTITKV